jgi:DNA-binding XRE family transcriptional regulator
MYVKSPLRMLRILSGQTQVQVGNASEINPARISLIENHLVTPRPDEKEKLAAALGLSVTDIWPAQSSAGDAAPGVIRHD